MTESELFVDPAGAPLGGAGAVTPKKWLQSFSSDLEHLGWEEGCQLDVMEDGTLLSSFKIDPAETQYLDVQGPPTFSLALCFSGRGEFAVAGGTPMRVETGAALLFHSSTQTSGKNVVFPDGPFEIVDIRYSTAFLSRIGGMPLNRLAHDLVTDYSGPQENAVFFGFQAPPLLLQEARKIAACPYPPGAVRTLYLYGAALQCLALTFEFMAQPYGQTAALSHGDQRRIMQAIHLLETDFQNAWTIAKLSDTVGLSAKKLKSGFRAKIGKTVGSHLRDVRLDCAEKMLLDGKSVTETAFACGFNNLSHFAKLFKAHKGLLPSHVCKTC